MAILKSYSSDFGIDFEFAYWMIARVDIERRQKKIAMAVDVFSSLDARIKDARPVGGYFAEITDGEDYDAVLAEGLPKLYEILKRSDALAGGVDA